jgi:hypothetical protein
MWLFSILYDAGYNTTTGSDATIFPPTPDIAVAIHPLYSNKGLAFDLALIRSDLTNYTGPPPTFLPTHIKNIAEGNAPFPYALVSLHFSTT